MKLSIKRMIPFLLLTAILFAGCGPAGTGGTTQATQPPAATPTVETAPTAQPPAAVSKDIHLDPATVADADSLAISAYVYDGLTILDASGQPQPSLALSWTPSGDQLDYVVTLRQGVKFQDGAVFNADVVMANFNRWFNPADPLHGTAPFSAWKQDFLGFQGEVDANKVPVSFYDGIEKVDAYTVLIHLNRPEPKLFAILAKPAYLILDPGFLASKAASFGTSAETVNGTGAYTITSWADAGLTLTPNANYWGTIPASPLQFGWK